MDATSPTDGEAVEAGVSPAPCEQPLCFAYFCAVGGTLSEWAEAAGDEARREL